MSFFSIIDKLEDNKILAREFLKISEDKDVISLFSPKSSFLVTGATGLLGSLIIKTLVYISQKWNLDFKIYCLYRNDKKFNSLFSNYLPLINKNLFLINSDLLEKYINLPKDINYIIHTISNTSSRSFVDFPIETINTNILGTEKILDFYNDVNYSSFLYISSMEVYGEGLNLEQVEESNYGVLESTNIRNSYPISKKIAELICTFYAKNFNKPIKIVRPTLVFGPGVQRNDNRVFMQFAYSVINNKNITLKTLGKSERDYIYSFDAVKAILLVLKRGKASEIYNISNPETYCSIKELAEHFIKLKPNLSIDYEGGTTNIYPKENHIKLSIEKLDSIYKFEKIPLDVMISNLINYLKEMK